LEYLGLYKKPRAEVHPGHKLTGPKEEEEDISLYFVILLQQESWHAKV
jgi:hypothetical protein